MEALIARLATLPALRAAAEAEARDLHNAWCAVVDLEPGWSGLPSVTRDNRIAAHLARLLDPLNPAAEGVLADIYRRETGRETAHVEPDATADYRVLNWQVVHLDPTVGMAQVPAWVDIDGTQAPTRYEAWARALLAHYDLAARKDGTGF